MSSWQNVPILIKGGSKIKMDRTLRARARRAQDSYVYRGFKCKGDRVHIIIFRVTTRLRSKSNRCI
jgi:hypothetical protein